MGSHVKLENQANLIREMSLEIKLSSEGCVPIIKTFESDPASSQKWVKDVKFYSRVQLDVKNHFVCDQGIQDLSYKTIDTSLLHFKNFVFFYMRKGGQFKLQQYDCVTHTHAELSGYDITEPQG